MLTDLNCQRSADSVTAPFQTSSAINFSIKLRCAYAMTIVKSWQESKALTVIPASNTRNLISLLPQPYILMLPQERHCFRTFYHD